MELRRNEETGIVEAWENGKVVGQIATMGDETDGTQGGSDKLPRGNRKGDDA